MAKRLKIEHIERAKAALEKAIRDNSLTRYPVDDSALDEAVHALIEATIAELVIEWRKGDC